MRRAAGEDTEYEVKVRTNVVPPYRVNITQGSPLGPNVWFFQVDQPGEQFKLLKEEDYVGPDPPLVFEDGFESGDIMVWSTIVKEGKTKGVEPTLIIAGPFR